MEATHQTTRSCQHNRSALAARIQRSRWSAAAGGETRRARKTTRKAGKTGGSQAPETRTRTPSSTGKAARAGQATGIQAPATRKVRKTGTSPGQEPAASQEGAG